jgi:hypothetical protein
MSAVVASEGQRVESRFMQARDIVLAIYLLV